MKHLAVWWLLGVKLTHTLRLLTAISNWYLRAIAELMDFKAMWGGVLVLELRRLYCLHFYGSPKRVNCVERMSNNMTWRVSNSMAPETPYKALPILCTLSPDYNCLHTPKLQHVTFKVCRLQKPTIIDADLWLLYVWLTLWERTHLVESRLHILYCVGVQLCALQIALKAWKFFSKNN